MGLAIAMVGGSLAGWQASDANPANTLTTTTWSDPLMTWGLASSGQTGASFTGTQNTSAHVGAVRMPGIETWSSVTTGYQHTCGITTASVMYCWGQNGSGQLGTGGTTAYKYPVIVSGGATWSTAGAGYVDTCAVKASDSTLWCWGDNSDGQLGDGNTTNQTSPTAVTTSGVQTWASVSVGYYSACGLKTDSSLWCWGENNDGQVGNNSTTNVNVPTQVSGTWTSVAVGYDHTCAILTSTSALYCWGDNANGQIGDGTTGTNRLVKTAVSTTGVQTWTAVAAAQDSAIGNGFTCGIKAGGTLWCWGYNGLNELGNNTTTNQSTPVQEYTASTNWSNVILLAHTGCGLRTTGALWCWGYNDVGEIADGTTTQRAVPVASGTSTAWSTLAGGYSTLCGVQADQGIWCQGNDGDGEIGMDGTELTSPSYVLPPASSFVSATESVLDGCGVRDTGTLWCWGSNNNGVDGVNYGSTNIWPAQVGAATNWQSVSVGDDTACAITTGNALYCWGSGGADQLGTGSTSDVHAPTGTTAGSWSSVSVGYDHTCAINTSNALYCWGYDHQGQLGVGSSDSTTPLQVSVAGVTWASVSAGYQETCAISTPGSTPASALYCWGSNSYGQLGQGTCCTNALTPVQIAGYWTGEAVGDAQTCAVKTTTSTSTTGSLYCWGQNDDGELGTGSTGNTSADYTPQQAGSATTWTQAGAGYLFSCGLQSDHSVWCWGYDSNSQLGDRATATRSSPQKVPLVTANSITLHGNTTTMSAISTPVVN